MKNILQLALFVCAMTAKSQVLLLENFENITTLSSNGWVKTDQTTPTPTFPGWFQGETDAFPAYEGATTSYIGSDAKGVITGNISNWLISPSVNLQNGDVISFYTRDLDDGAADRLELRISQLGTSSVIPAGGDTALGSFTLLALSINPNLILTGYPSTWTQYSYTISGLTGLTNCKVAFRYFVTGITPQLTNGGFIGIDSFKINRGTLNSPNFNQNNVSISPNPATNIVKINTPKTITQVEIYDVLGRNTSVKKIDLNTIDISDLSTGTYIMNLTLNDASTISKKIIKQ